MNAHDKTLDCLTIGRSSVDLYGGQIGGRLEDMRSFDKYLGGSPTNMAAGASRLGLKAGVITRVGDEHMGRFIREQLQREGVDVTGVTTDPERLTALVILGIRDEDHFPLIFYRENCADMALSEDDIDPALIARTRSIVATGTHLSHPRTEAAVLKALGLARKGGARTALDIDYRPNLWGLSGHGDGENRFIASEKVTAKLRSTLNLFDLIVGTEEEFHIAGGTTDTLEALRQVRAVTAATLVLKRGAKGASAFTGAIPDSLDGGIAGKGFAIEVFNVLGAGDGFMAGLLKGWLDDAGWAQALTYANACGAFAVSRHGCTPAYPSLEELRFFLKNGATTPALRKDEKLEQVHWSTNRAGDWPEIRIFAFDHRIQLEDMAAETGADAAAIAAFKRLCLKAAVAVAGSDGGFGILCDNRLGRDALYEAADTGLWIGRPAEWPGSCPLTLEQELGADFGGLSEWPAGHVVKVLCFYHPDDPPDLRQQQEETLHRLFVATRRHRLEFLLEIIASKSGDTDDATLSQVIERIYAIGIYPDWWKLEPLTSEKAWERVCGVIERHDRFTRGIVILGLDQPEETLIESFRTAKAFPLVKGFAVGRTIFGQAARLWLAGEISDDQAVTVMRDNFERLCSAWDQLHPEMSHAEEALS
ncbi:5-dehydro-2-deoxygluconokinase [Martelella sp. HB161492]|uniref:bifunctional 5-dehydro-2-deoxygluconokinase/5-dehydro-2- deoxyphosphogluconate aldolase n=1 Tax=Martelella sp. HB161492 TaxID=2720726 RepID=UPI001590C26C|nr:5-dehydro-2-deoxygluconokinase [Martelella sp. HB161492]